jgi:cephalosporin hydroxylase
MRFVESLRGEPRVNFLVAQQLMRGPYKRIARYNSRKHDQFEIDWTINK